MEEKRSALYARMPEDIIEWVDHQAEKLGLAQAEWLRVLFTNLKANYSDKEVMKIFLGIKTTLSQRDVLRDKNTASKNSVKKSVKIAN